jgi:hypothetical protein
MEELKRINTGSKNSSSAVAKVLCRVANMSGLGRADHSMVTARLIG